MTLNDLIAPIQEYLVKDPKKVAEFIDKEIDLEYEIDDKCITVFGVEDVEEHMMIKKFITDNNLWAK